MSLYNKHETTAWTRACLESLDHRFSDMPAHFPTILNMFEIKYTTLIIPNEGSDYTLWKLMVKEPGKRYVRREQSKHSQLPPSLIFQWTTKSNVHGRSLHKGLNVQSNKGHRTDNQRWRFQLSLQLHPRTQASEALHSQFVRETC